MATTATPTSESAVSKEHIRDQWVHDVMELVHKAKSWSSCQGWETKITPTTLGEEVTGGIYTVDQLTIDAPTGRLVLEPVARGTMGADGRVDLYAWPSFFRVQILRRKGQWIVRTESGLDWPQPWGAETFRTIAEGLLRA